MIAVTARYNPFESRLTRFSVPEGLRVSEIVAAAPMQPAFFSAYAVAVVDGQVVPQDRWPHVRVKRARVIELRAMPMGGGGSGSTKNILTTVALIGLIAATGFVASGGLVGLGLGSTATLGAGTLGANLAAAGIGLAGQLALTALAPPPPKPPGADQQLSQAGIAGNALTPLAALPGVLGTIRLSPPLLAPPYTTFQDGIITGHAVFGWGNRALVEDVLINGADVSSYDDVTVETREGTPGDAVITTADKTVLEQRANTEVKGFITEMRQSIKDLLIHQSDPDLDLPQFQVYRTRFACDEIWFRLFWPTGMVEVTNDPTGMPFRIEMRPVGSSTWLKLPVVHFTDPRAGKQMRQQVRLKFGTRDADGAGYDTELPAFAAHWKTGRGSAYEYAAEDCFSFGDMTPDMTAATTAGCTFSASNDNGGANPAWKAGDDDMSTSWRTAATTSGYLRVQLPAAKTVGAYTIGPVGSAQAPKDWTFRGSNDGSTWTVLDTQTGFTAYDGTPSAQFPVPYAARAPYLYYELTFTAVNGGTYCAVAEFSLNADWIAGYGYLSIATTNFMYAANVAVDGDGYTIWLDEGTFPKGDYEVRIQRGLAFRLANMSGVSNYYFGAGANDANLFEYYLSGGDYVVRYGQVDFSADVIMEVFTSYSNDYPFGTLPGVGMIAIEAPNLQVASVSALLTSYAAEYSGGIWQPVETPTANPAALYRKVLLGTENAMALPGEIVDEDNLATWSAWCDGQGHVCNAVVQGQTVESILKLIAASGWAVPRQSALWGVIYERDRSAEEIVQMFTGRNTRSAGLFIDFPKRPHAIRAEYLDETDDYQTADDLIYAEGYDASNATLIEAVDYPGFTTAARVSDRATLDIRQSRYRQAKDVREVAWESLVSQRGDLVGVNDDVLVSWQGSSIIASVQTSGPNITGVTLEATIDLAAAQAEVGAVGDVTAITDVTATPQAMGIAIRGDTGTIITKPINETTATRVITFVTPFATPSDVVAGCLVSLGVLGSEFKRKLIFAIEPGDGFTARITLIDEAPEIHA